MTTPIETDDLRALFDIALKTGDFVSGLLDREEIDLLRKLAVRLGVDPMEATPSKYAGSYPHAPKPRDWDPEDCEWDCRKPIDDPIHTAEVQRDRTANRG